MSKIQAAKQREAKQRGEAQRAKSLERARNDAYGEHIALYQPPTPSVSPDLPWEEGKAEPEAIRKAREASELNGVVRPKTRWENQQAQAKREGFRNAWEMRQAKRKSSWPHPKPIAEHKRKRGDAPEAGHPWRNKPAELPEGFDARFDYKYGEVQHLVKDGRPLTEQGAKLLNRPQPVVVSPADKPLYSLETQQVHSYQQTHGRK